MAYYNVCPVCGSNLDPGERCDCQSIRAKEQEKNRLFFSQMLRTEKNSGQICPRCNHILNAGPDYQPDYCSKCGQHVNCSDVPWEEEVQLGYVRKEERCE